jgi:hypothetical protein
MNKELTLRAPLKGGNWKGVCQCGNFTTYLPSAEAVERMHLDHLFLWHAEYTELGLETFRLKWGKA